LISVPCCGKELAPAVAAAPGAGSCDVAGGCCPGGIGGTPMGGQPGNMAGTAEIKIQLKFTQLMHRILFFFSSVT